MYFIVIEIYQNIGDSDKIIQRSQNLSSGSKVHDFYKIIVGQLKNIKRFLIDTKPLRIMK